MGTMREKDCFVTNTECELITDIEKTLIEFQLEDVGNPTVFNEDSMDNGNEYITKLNETKL